MKLVRFLVNVAERFAHFKLQISRIWKRFNLNPGEPTCVVQRIRRAIL